MTIEEALKLPKNHPLRFAALYGGQGLPERITAKERKKRLDRLIKFFKKGNNK